MLQKIKERERGFTIIEVLIVLAIAGLILLIVFLAVPALQRNARNTSRKNDVSALASALSEYIDNTGGTVPAASCTGAPATPCAFLSDWNPGFYTKTATTFTYTYSATVPANAPGDPKNVDNIAVYSAVACNPTGTAASTANASVRNVAILYDVEVGGGGYQEQCVTAQ